MISLIGATLSCSPLINITHIHLHTSHSRLLYLSFHCCRLFHSYSLLYHLCSSLSSFLILYTPTIVMAESSAISPRHFSVITPSNLFADQPRPRMKIPPSKSFGTTGRLAVRIASATEVRRIHITLLTFLSLIFVCE